MRSRVALALVLLAALAVPARALDWNLIVPGESTTASIRARWGEPTKAAPQKIEGYDALEWVYEGALAPVGMERMVVDFGLLTAAGYKPDTVRSFRLDPRPGTFTKKLVVDGWGVPLKVGVDAGRDVFVYEDGLLVYFEKDGVNATTMIFTLPQPITTAPPQR